MRNIVKRIMGRGSEDQKGFTLIELLIVVGIIVALAAVIIPLVIQFAGRGETGSQAAEDATVQTAVDAFMTDESVATLPAIGDGLGAAPTLDVITGAETLGIVGTANDLADYIRDLPTQCAYSWDTAGLVTQGVCY